MSSDLEQTFDRIHNLVRIRNDTSETSEMLYWDLALDSETDVLDHLAGVDLQLEDSLHLSGEFLDFLRRERPEGYRTKKTDLDALTAGDLDALLRDTRR